VLYLRERREPIGQVEAEKLLSLKIRRGGPEVLRGIQETVSALLGVQVDAFQSGPPRRGREGGAAEMDVDNFLVEVNGSGIREALRVVLDVEFDQPAILLVEEPEIHLHPALEISLMHYLKKLSKTRQIFISTHSTNFLDTAEMRNVYLVTKEDGTKAQLLDFDAAEAQIPQELGIRLSSLFMYDRLVFVEGPSDEATLRELAGILGLTLSQENVGFVSLGGVRNFGYFASDAIIEFLTRRQVRLWFVLDRDERKDSEIQKLSERLGESAVLEVLNRRELENYLIVPRAAAEFIKLKQSLGGSQNGEISEVSEEDVREAIGATADDLRRAAVDKRVAHEVCRPFVIQLRDVGEGGEDSTLVLLESELGRIADEVQNTRDRLGDIERSAEEEITKEWETRKLDLVPGDLLLDEVCRRFGVRFRKERGDSARLAGLLREDEIHEDLKRIIRAFGLH
jgi:putative ATP-dependent endonuclease of OLD family